MLFKKCRSASTIIGDSSSEPFLSGHQWINSFILRNTLLFPRQINPCSGCNLFHFPAPSISPVSTFTLPCVDTHLIPKASGVPQGLLCVIRSWVIPDILPFSLLIKCKRTQVSARTLIVDFFFPENHQFHMAAKPSLTRLRSIGHVSFQSYAVVIVFPI